MRTALFCYSVLGLDEKATFPEVKSTYRQLAKKYHPDIVSARNGSVKPAVEMFKKINNAYDYLRRTHTETNEALCSGWLGFTIKAGWLDNNRYPIVSEVTGCSPAGLAGLRVDDYIVGFNDRSTLGMSKPEIRDLFSGDAGIPAKIEVYRENKGAVYTLYTIRLQRPSHWC